uniref:Uncharacterized protein n=1 Tax=Aegilops tauschii subsp. strangulata TaxID=200361 RepID=A0A453CJ28_AEGTS
DAARAHLRRVHRPGDQRVRPDADGQAHAHARPHRGVRLDRRDMPDGLQRVPGPRRPLRGKLAIPFVHTAPVRNHSEY